MTCSVEIKTPLILANYQNPDPSKWQDRSKTQKELAKQIEEIIRHYAMPKGVKTMKFSGLS
jgi:inorganic pyrophosphatase